MTGDAAMRRGVLLRVLLVSVAALAVPVAGALWFSRVLGDYAALLWLLALMPGFLLAYENGMRAAALALALGMAVLSMAYLGLHLMGHAPPRLLWAVVPIYAVVALGTGELAERLRGGSESGAYRDEASGLPKRRFAELHLEREFAAAARGRPLAVALVRLAGPEGNRAAAVRSASRRLAAITRRMNVTAHYGAATFLCLLGNCDEEGALGFARRVQRVLREAGEGEPSLAASVGVACYRPSQRRPSELLRAAEAALEDAEREGGDRLRLAGRPIEPTPAAEPSPPAIAPGAGLAPFAPRRAPVPEPGRLGVGRRAFVSVREDAARERLAADLQAERFEVEATGDLAAGRGEADADVLFVDLGDEAAAAFVAEARERRPAARIVGVVPPGPDEMGALYTVRVDACCARGAELAAFRPQLAELLAERDWILGAETRVQQMVEEVRATARESRRAMRRSEEMLQRSQKMDAVGRLAGGIAHDFNNLLTTVRGHTELLIADLGPDEPMRADLLEIRDATVRATTLTRQLLGFTSREVHQPRILDLGGAVHELERMLRRVIGEHIAMETILGEGDLHVKADAAQIDQILLNLVVNARDAMPDGGRLQIAVDALTLEEPRRSGTALPPGEYVRLRVRDTGEGMDAGLRARIFEPFFTTKEPGRGTGLGLSTVHSIVEQSGGDILVESELGEGTTFSILLPRAGESQQAASRASGPASPRRDKTILLVEDEEAVRRLISRILGDAGYAVLVAPTPALALDILGRDNGDIALLISDLVMPGIDGVELAHRVREQRPGLPILFVSGYGEDAVPRDHLPADASFLEKPFTPRALDARVREMLAASSTA